MSQSNSTAATIAGDAAVAVGGLVNVASAVETDLSTHKSILNTAADAGEAALTSLKSPTVVAALGMDATAVSDVIDSGVAVGGELSTLISDLKSGYAKLLALISKL